ncbi:MAG: DNA mismatch repair endonuclease MutL [Tissierellia bacterium]|nr:DNA mismatch repair endonuclease MutL [Tissierellia bacterium]
MGMIRVLDESTIQKIAAGEVIERPSSAVKELVENSLDAGSTSITIEIRNGGKSYIRVTDDGSGITKEDLQIAFKRHSTSKLNNADDLYRVMSFGFRGEALASIAAISRIEVLSKTANDQVGTHALLNAGDIIKLGSVGCPKGTTIIVNSIFYNMPVRENFLMSDNVESNHISDVIYKLALGNPGVAFTYIRDNRIIFKTSKNNNLISNIYSLLGKDFHDNLVQLEHADENLNIHGYISNNKMYRSNRAHQYLYVNNRYIKNQNIISLINDKYRSIIPINRFPVFVLFIDIEPRFIDVNIHPTKEEIKFINQSQVDQQLENVLERTIKGSLSIAKSTLSRDHTTTTTDLPLLYDKDSLDHSKHIAAPTMIMDTKSHYTGDETIERPEKTEIGDFQLNDILKKAHIIGTIFTTYILLEDVKSATLFIIDQHAAHERIIYERFREQFLKEDVSIQSILEPEIIELNNRETQMVIENMDLFKRVGFLVEEFGTNSVIIRGVPILFGKPQSKDLFLDILDTIGSDIRSGYEVKLDKIIKIACVNAIKSGDKMNDIEIRGLIDQLSTIENPYTCPHGRPVIIEVSKTDIDKEFRRIV